MARFSVVKQNEDPSKFNYFTPVQLIQQNVFKIYIVYHVQNTY